MLPQVARLIDKMRQARGGSIGAGNRKRLYGQPAQQSEFAIVVDAARQLDKDIKAKVQTEAFGKGADVIIYYPDSRKATIEYLPSLWTLRGSWTKTRRQRCGQVASRCSAFAWRPLARPSDVQDGAVCIHRSTVKLTSSGRSG